MNKPEDALKQIRSLLPATNEFMGLKLPWAVERYINQLGAMAGDPVAAAVRVKAEQSPDPGKLTEAQRAGMIEAWDKAQKAEQSLTTKPLDDTGDAISQALAPEPLSQRDGALDDAGVLWRCKPKRGKRPTPGRPTRHTSLTY